MTSHSESRGRLDEWIAAHGSLSPRSAGIVALDICTRASDSSREHLRRTIGSLGTAAITRGDSGSWSWNPTTGIPTRADADTDVIERIGAILFECLTGQPPTWPFPTESAVRPSLRRLGPELPPAVIDVVVRALSVRTETPRLTLASLARELRQAFGLENRSSEARRRPRALLGAALAVLGIAAAWSWTANRVGDGGVGSHGLTERETIALDILNEAAQAFAMIDEHTAAIQRDQQIGRLWRTHVPPGDARPLWSSAHEAWVRSLAGDRITTEQILGNPPAFASALGERHPYTRAVLLELAATLEARGATVDAAALRNQADRAAGALVADVGVLLPGVPAPPGVVAHLAPNAPEREGFRRSSGAEFFVPLTSTQRLFGGRDGWRLHVIASGACRASVVVGNTPRLVVVTTTRTEDKRWRVGIDGMAPPVTVNGLAGDTVGLSLIADGNGAVLVRLAGGKTLPAVVDTTARPPDPPYSLAFSGGADGSGCDLVWLEIPFPFAPTS